MHGLRALREIALKKEVMRTAAEMTERRDAHMAESEAKMGTKPPTSAVAAESRDEFCLADIDNIDICSQDSGDDGNITGKVSRWVL